jgi:hypothetical protein
MRSALSKGLNLEKKSKVKPLSYYKKKAWDTISKYIRKLYSDDDGISKCYTCEKEAHWKALQAGHAIPGRNNAVLLDVDILRPQCVGCNIFNHGMHHIFATKLILENGEEWWLKKLAGSNAVTKISRSEYIDIIEQYKEKE